MMKRRKARLYDDQREATTTTADKIYENLKALGVNIDAVKNCSPSIDELKQFHNGILSILERHQGNAQAYAS
jgi:hypothetical protein